MKTFFSSFFNKKSNIWLHFSAFFWGVYVALKLYILFSWSNFILIGPWGHNFNLIDHNTKYQILAVDVSFAKNRNKNERRAFRDAPAFFDLKTTASFLTT